MKKRTPLIGLGVLFAAGVLMAAIGQPMENVGTCTFNVTTTASSVQALATAACGKPLPEEGFFAYTFAAAADKVCVGGTTVDTVVDAGGECHPMCTTLASCKYDYYSARATPSAVWMVRANGTLPDSGPDTSATTAVTAHAGGPL